MRPISFDADLLRRHLHRQRIATLTELKQVLGTAVDVTVFRKLKTLDYLSSYSHRGRYYTLRPIAHFDPDGLWAHEGVWFSRYGTLLSTAEAVVTQAPTGDVAEGVPRGLPVELHNPRRRRGGQGRARRSDLSGVYLYTAAEAATHRRQLQARRAAHALPLAVNAAALLISRSEQRR